MNSKELVDEGYRKIYSYGNDEDEKDEIIKETFAKDEILQNTSEEAVEKQTTPPARYTQASFLKDLDKKGIGRPATYATIVKTLLDPTRGYVKEEFNGEMFFKNSVKENEGYLMYIKR